MKEASKNRIRTSVPPFATEQTAIDPFLHHGVWSFTDPSAVRTASDVTRILHR